MTGSETLTPDSPVEAPAFHVGSEVGRLRKVLVHRPDLSLQRLTPSNVRDLLFDDVLWVRRAREQHDVFVDHLRGRGVEVYLLRDLLSETLTSSQEARQEIVKHVVTERTVGASLRDEIQAYLLEMRPDDLATHLIGGLERSEMEGLDLTGSLMVDRHVGLKVVLAHRVLPHWRTPVFRRLAAWPGINNRPACASTPRPWSRMHC